MDKIHLVDGGVCMISCESQETEVSLDVVLLPQAGAECKERVRKSPSLEELRGEKIGVAQVSS